MNGSNCASKLAVTTIIGEGAFRAYCMLNVFVLLHFIILEADKQSPPSEQQGIIGPTETSHDSQGCVKPRLDSAALPRYCKEATTGTSTLADYALMSLTGALATSLNFLEVNKSGLNLSKLRALPRSSRCHKSVPLRGFDVTQGQVRLN